MNFIAMRHPETGGRTHIPDSPDVLAVHEARGWEAIPAAELAEATARPFVPVPAPDGSDAEAAAWVDLVHPDLPTGHNRVPNNEAALQGAFEAGWTYPEPDPELVQEVAQEIREDAGKRRGRPTKAELAEAEELAARAAAETDEPPGAPATGEQTSAGDGTQQEE